MTGGLRRSWLVFGTLLLAGLDYSFLQSLIAPALTTFQSELHTSVTATGWIQTSFLLSSAVATTVVGRLGDTYRRKRLMVGVLALLGAGTLIAALSTTLPVLLVGRVLEGGAFAVFPLAFGIIRDEFPQEQRARKTAVMSVTVGAGAAGGLILSGPVLQHLSYHWLFWSPLILIVITLGMVAVVLPDAPAAGGAAGGWIAALPFAGALLAALVVISEGRTWGWLSAPTLVALAVTACASWLWVRLDVRAVHPLLDPAVARATWPANAATAALHAGWFAAWVLVPQIVELPRSTGYGLSAGVTEGGLVFLPAVAAMIAVSPMAPRLRHVSGVSVPLVGGSVVVASSFALLAVRHNGWLAVIVAAVLLGAGIGMFLAAAANVVVDSVRPDQTAAATGLNMLSRIVGGAIGTQGAAAFLAGGGSIVPSESSFEAAFAAAAALAVASALVCGLWSGGAWRLGQIRLRRESPS